jgi:hypothetical protein
MVYLQIKFINKINVRYKFMAQANKIKFKSPIEAQEASTETAGLMSAKDKAKLDNQTASNIDYEMLAQAIQMLHRTDIAIVPEMKYVNTASIIPKDKKVIMLQDGAETIGDATFANGTLQYITMPSSINSIGEGAFQNSDLKYIEIPGSVKEIPTEAFSGCTSLTAVAIAPGVKKIGSNAFKGCEILGTIYIPQSLTEIEASAFSDACTKLSSSGCNIYYQGTESEWNTLKAKHDEVFQDLVHNVTCDIAYRTNRFLV